MPIIGLRWAEVKRYLRLGLKYGQTVVRGYPLGYARHQEDIDPTRYGHTWAVVATPIPDRGSDEVRANRIWNLNLAAGQIHGLVLQPQQIFGFWNRVSAPSLNNGFRSGPVFTQGQVRTDVGGGLCLVSTNLYNALLGAGWQILERHGHSIDPYGEQRYFTLGQDASVAYGYKDLIARHTSPGPVQLRFQVITAPQPGDLLTVPHVRSQICGTVPMPYEVKIHSTVLEQIAPQPHQQIPGWRVKTVRMVRPIQPLAARSPEEWTIDYWDITEYQPCLG